MEKTKTSTYLRIANLEEVIAFREKIKTTCYRCDLGPKVEKLGYWPVGSRGNGRIMFIGHAPGDEEHANGQPFVGRAGRTIDKLLWQYCGLTDEQMCFTNTIRCRPSQDTKLKRSHFRACSPFITKEIALVDPPLIVYFGQDSSAGTVDSSDYPGAGRFFKTVIAGKTRKCYAMLHPALIFRSPKMSSAVISQMETLGSYIYKTFGYSGTKTPNIDTHSKTSVDYILVDDPQKLKDMYTDLYTSQRLGCDTETTSLDVWRESFSLVGVSLASRLDRAYYIPIGHKFSGRDIFARPFKQLNWVSEVLPVLKRLFTTEGRQLVFHNYAYDYRVLKKYGINIDKINPSSGVWEYHDSMIMSYLHDETVYSLGLKDQVPIHMHEHPKHFKDVIGDKKTFEFVSPADALPYAGDDARYTLALFNLLLPRVLKDSKEKTGNLLLNRIYPEELKTARVMSDAHMIGVQLDDKYLTDLQSIIDEDIIEVQERIDNISPLADPSSPAQLIAMMHKIVSDSRFKKKFEAEFGAMSSKKTFLLSLAKQYRILYNDRASKKKDLPGSWTPDILEDYIKNVVRYRHLVKMKATYIDAMLNEAENQDGVLVLHPDFKTVGTTSGRMASGKRSEEDR